MRTSILVVEDNIQLAVCLEMLLEANSYEVYRTSDGVGGLESIRLMDFDVILSDINMPGLDGYQLLGEVSRIKPHLCDRFIFMSGYPSEWSLRPDVDRPILKKPFNLERLLLALNEVIEPRQRKQIELSKDSASDNEAAEAPTVRTSQAQPAQFACRRSKIPLI
jgi:DNA-binding NtrC family response regulator